MHSNLSNLSLFAQLIFKVGMYCGFGPGIVIMGLYNFQSRFVSKILSGAKTHTIRALRTNPDKPGNVLHLYTGLRQKGAKLLMRVPCVKVEQISIDSRSGDPAHCRLEIDGQFLDRSEKELLARRDGFANFAEMLEFWKDRLPFRGHIIHWQLSQTSSGGGQLAKPLSSDSMSSRSTKALNRATSPPRKERRRA